MACARAAAASAVAAGSQNDPRETGDNGGNSTLAESNKALGKTIPAGSSHAEKKGHASLTHLAQSKQGNRRKKLATRVGEEASCSCAEYVTLS